MTTVGAIVFDPDQQVQRAVRLLFETFRRTGSAMRVVHHFKTEGLLWPRRHHLLACTRENCCLGPWSTAGY